MKPIGIYFIPLIICAIAFSQPASSNDPKIGPRDVLSITVFNESDLSLDVVVSGDGDFNFPLLEKVKAAGLTSGELEQHMQQRLKDEGFLVNPTVLIRIVEQNSEVVTISGAVKKPGVTPIYPGIRLRELIARQGGVDENQAGPYIHLQRTNGEQIQIDREELLRSGDVLSATLNVQLSAGDEIMIPFAESIYILGAVTIPGRIPLTRSMTIGDAMGLAGGRTSNAGYAMLWHHIDEEGAQQLNTFTIDQYQSDPAIRNRSLRAGDSIFVPQNDMVFVSGQVEKPGAYPWKPDMTITSAIVEAGDRTFVASRTIRVYRRDAEGHQQMTKYSLSDLQKNKVDNRVLPGDIIHVSHSILNIPYTVRKLNPFSLPLSVLESSVF